MVIGKVAALVLGSAFAAVSAQAAELKLTIEGVRSDRGAVMMGLYDSPERFSKAIEKASDMGRVVDEDRFVGATLRARRGKLRVAFDLPPGRYAIIVFHDENDDGRLDKSMLGIPNEGYGFSNNATGFLSAPSFESAEVDIGSEDRSIVISLGYPDRAGMMVQSR